MNCKEKLFKICAVFIFGIVGLSLLSSGMDDAVTHTEMNKDPISCFPTHEPAPPSAMLEFSEFSQTADAPPMVRLFQILFILFIISPPIIALILFLILQELKKRNKMK